MKVLGFDAEAFVLHWQLVARKGHHLAAKLFVEVIEGLQLGKFNCIHGAHWAIALSE